MFRDGASVVAYIGLYVAFDILIADSGRQGKGFAYNVATVVFLTEFGKFIFSAFFWLAEFLAWNNKSVVVIRNNLAKIDLKTTDNKKEKLTTIRKVRFKEISKRRTCIWPFVSVKQTDLNCNVVEGNWPCVGDVLVGIRRYSGKPHSAPEKIQIPGWDTIRAVEDLWHKLRAEGLSKPVSKGENQRIELIFERRVSFPKLVLRSAPMAIPAFMYTVWNIINFEALLRVNLAEYSIFYQMSLLFTVVLWTLVFQKSYNWMQWLGIMFMVIGCSLTRLGEKDFSFHWSWALLYVMAQALISAVAGVLNEVVYKCEGMEQLTLHVQNAALYGYSAFFHV